jgi:hypothetical protein
MRRGCLHRLDRLNRLAILGICLAAACAPEDSPPQSKAPFEGPPSLTLPGVHKASGLACEDLNADGKLDIIVLSTQDPAVLIMLGKDGGYSVSTRLAVGPSAGNFATGDFNEDKKTDIAVCHHDVAEIWIFLGKGNAEFANAQRVSVPAKKPHLHMLETADVNGDKHVDLLLAQSDDNEAWVLLGDGKGGFSPSAGSPLKTGNHAYVVVAEDFNGDGKVDFATPNWHGKSISVFLGDGKGGFKKAPGSPLTGFTAPITLAAGDLTGDGKTDLALGNDDADRVQILAGDGSGRFSVGAVPDLVAKDPCISPVLADLNGDGKLDVIVSSVNEAPTFGYWLNLGEGKFSPAHTLSLPGMASRILVLDFNGDRKMDLLVGAWNEPRILVWYGKP